MSAQITKEVWNRVLDHIENSGLKPLCSVRLEGVGVTTYYEKLEKDTLYAQSIKKAVIAFKQYHLDNIKKHCIKDWKASAWLLERTFKQEYSLQAEDKNDSEFEAIDFEYTVKKDNKPLYA